METDERGRNGNESVGREELDVSKDQQDVASSCSRDLDSPDAESTPQPRKYLTKHMKLYPELYRSDCSIHPSYTDLRNLPYHVVCRRRVQRLKKQIARQLQRDVKHFAMMQMLAIDSVRIDRIFTVGMSPKALIVPDFATEKERRRINELLRYP